MKSLVIAGVVVLSMSLIGCGNSAVGSNAVGQVKYVKDHTPMVCGDYKTVGVSLGVMANGVGSMSTHDETLTIDPTNVELLKLLKDANMTGAPIEFTFDTRRFSWCQELLLIKSAKLMDIKKPTVQVLGKDSLSTAKDSTVIKLEERVSSLEKLVVKLMSK